MKLISIEQQDRVAVLRMNTGKANALNEPLLRELGEALEQGGREANALVLTGYEIFFSAGLDLVALSAMDRPALSEFVELFSETLINVFRFSLPLVAAVNGHAVAGGTVLALACDYRVMTRNEAARAGLRELELGIPLPAVAMEICRLPLTASVLVETVCRGKSYGPQEALRLGLADELVEDSAVLERSLHHARELGQKPAAAFAQVKAEIRRPYLERIRARHGEQKEQFLDLWYSAESQARIGAVVQTLKSKARS